MSSNRNGGKQSRDRERGGLVRRGLRSLSFRSTKGRKSTSTSHDTVDGQPSKQRHRLSIPELTNNNNGVSKLPPVSLGIAVLPFRAILPCDLSFNVGDRIDILTRTNRRYDWWEGRLNGRTGIFPANYIKVVT